MTVDDKCPLPSMLDVAAVAALLSCSVRHVWRMCDAGHFPRPVALGLKLKRWPRAAVKQWPADQAYPKNGRRQPPRGSPRTSSTPRVARAAGLPTSHPDSRR